MGFDRILPTKMDQTHWQYVSQFAKPWRCLARKSSAKGSFVQANDCLPEGKQLPLPDTNWTVVLELGCFRNPQSCCQLFKVWTRSIIPFNYTYVHVCYPCFLSKLLELYPVQYNYSFYDIIKSCQHNVISQIILYSQYDLFKL